MPEAQNMKISSLYSNWIGNKRRMIRCACLLFLTFGSVSWADKPNYLAGNLRGYSHTAASVNSFSVNGYGGSGARKFGQSGAVCCIVLPRQWRPGLMLNIEWETDPNPDVDVPPIGTDAFRAFMLEHEKNYKQHKTTVELPPYENGMCGMEVHFLPCNEVKVSTSCWRYPSPNSPIKEPKRMEEPSTCPKPKI